MELNWVSITGKYIAVNAIHQKRSKNNNLSCLFRKPEKEKQFRHKASRRKQITNIRVESNKVYSRKVEETKTVVHCL